ncbi:hypothetical protein GGTG_14194 [Gaeumannomyces tritici R3-111a-1]|uniref:Uncharacterized protein n=1 Tax=Gaeumannomyces tritici (strain R3-111a-1) TaxID=644352 RepID=J3PKX0_GAET3|nr:hypothetical protein GGTG_14194 [Gaeumannomyces tritici R3-111a-1]EJT68226.1 hypothetical protein GGTG_14194 [Gaeumannomyces tritici R3-111a-1]
MKRDELVDLKSVWDPGGMGVLRWVRKRNLKRKEKDPKIKRKRGGGDVNARG